MTHKKSFDNTNKMNYNKKVSVFYFLTNFLMGKNKNLIATGLTAVALSASPVNAETLTTSNEVKQEIQKVKQVCETQLECIKLSNSIQAQIDELEANKELSPREKFKLIKLNKKLIAVENQKQEKQKITIAEEKQETEYKKIKTAKNDEFIAKEQQETIEAKKTDKKIDELRGALL